MGAIELGTIIALVGCFVGLAGWLTGRDKRVANDAQWRGSVDAKLDLIVGIKSDVAKLDTTVGNHSERLAKVESSTAQAHHRIDEIIKK
ncbi:hypothetical protein [Clostridium minihomine]|uniref:hypothetical protein n=1 Tax=Clostridium minihomine TaxID=2045012 RepID=UPI000C77CD4D|nr:hypothetical protein [Clostridium minihomine]